MYLGRPFALSALLVLSLFSEIALSGGENIHRRQDGNVAVTTSNNKPSPSTDSRVPSQTSVSRAATNTGSNAPSPTENSQSSSSSSGSGGKSADGTIKSSPAPTMAEGGDGLSSNNTTNPADEIYRGGLPINPVITPGIAVAGVFLLLAGIPYCLIGIKIKFLHIFLSTALLASLGVTVLVVYVMNPPVKFAIEGAYVTAATITGLLTGGLAVVFPEVTEALGCLLGGFCVSMWFLVLKPGGLVASVYGKLILIAVFCFALFALAFHRLTRPYSLIFSLSFSGATTIVLGIDCFSRAGLKEFWLYIWALNDNIFPLATNNYPHTRGIRVEIAVIVLITGFGVMSQVKLWNILKERRDTKDAERRRQDADIEAMDADAGLRVEEEHKLEREQWEATFGRKKVDEVTAEERPATGRISRTDSGIGDDVGYGKNSIDRVEEFVETEEMRREREEHIQMAQMGGSGSQSINVSRGGTVKSQGPSNQDQTSEDVDKAEPVEGPDSPKHEGTLTPGTVSRRQSSQSITPSHSNQLTPQRLSSQSMVSLEAAVQRPDVPPPPVVIPLPVPIPVETEDDDDEVSSLATFAGSDRVISQEIDEDAFRSVVKMVDEEDRASSVAATLDDNEDEVVEPTEKDFSPINEASHEDSPPHPPVKVEVEEVLDESYNRDSNSSLVGEETQAITEDKSERAEAPEPRTSDVPQQNNTEKDVVTEDHSKRTDSPDETTLVAPTSASTLPSTSPPSVVSATPMNLAQMRGDLAPASTPKSKSSSPPPPVPETQLRAKCSKVVKNYRTNEWAKHLADAELPELDRLEETLGAIDASEEAPAPVHIEELQETAAIKPPAPSRPVSKISNRGNPSPTPAPVSRPPVQLGKPRSAIRTSSAPNPLPESDSPVERSMPLTGRATPVPFTQNTLIGKRESMVRSRQSFNALAEYGAASPSPTPQPPPEPKHQQPMAAPTPNAPSVPQRQSTGPFAQLPTSDNKSAYQYRLSMLDDDMPLSDRRNELLQHVIPQAGAVPAPPQQQQRRSLPSQVDRREAMLRNWRETVKTELQTSGHTTHAIQERRGEMLNERIQSIQNERHKNLKENFRDEMFDERMRQKDMLNLHKEAMRRMQASANKHI